MQRIYQVALGTKCDILKTEPQLGERLLKFKAKTGASVVCLQAMLRSEINHHYVLTTAFKGYFEEYVRGLAFLEDPIFNRCASAKSPFEWSSMPSASSEPGRQPLISGRRWLTLPIVHDQVIACLHVAADASDEEWRASIADFIWHGMKVGDDIVHRLLQLRNNDFAPPVRLSPTQVDCLTLLAAGKDIAHIVDITGRDYRAVNRQISEAMCRLNARTQSHAVVKAISLGFLPPGN